MTQRLVIFNSYFVLFGGVEKSAYFPTIGVKTCLNFGKKILLFLPHLLVDALKLRKVQGSIQTGGHQFQLVWHWFPPVSDNRTGAKRIPAVTLPQLAAVHNSSEVHGLCGQISSCMVSGTEFLQTDRQPANGCFYTPVAVDKTKSKYPRLSMVADTMPSKRAQQDLLIRLYPTDQTPDEANQTTPRAQMTAVVHCAMQIQQLLHLDICWHGTRLFDLQWVKIRCEQSTGTEGS